MEILLVILIVQAVTTILLIQSRRTLLLSNLALRQQLAAYKRRQERPALKNRDRLFWLLLSRISSGWKSCLVIVQPETSFVKSSRDLERRSILYTRMASSRPARTSAIRRCSAGRSVVAPEYALSS